MPPAGRPRGALAALLALCSLLPACGASSSSGGTDPTIAQFTATPGTIPNGGSASLVAEFDGESATIDHGVGAVTSGVPVSTGPLSSSTTYTLTVAGSSGRTATAQAQVAVAPAAAVSSFSASPASITTGQAATLTAVFSGTSATVDHGLGAISSGVPVSTGPLSASTTYTVTVTGQAGDQATAQATVTVQPPPPTITSFSASPASVASGGQASLTAVFSGGTGTVDHGIGAVSSGVPVSTGPLDASTTYTLTVTGGAGGQATAQATVTVQSSPATITSFSASPATIPAGQGSSLTAVFSGGAGTIDHGVGAVTSGAPVSTGPLSATTSYTLTVDGGGGPATARATVTVRPVVTSFSASPASIAAGQSASLTAVFAGGSGSVDHGVGAVSSGVPVSTGALSASTTYSLTVTGSDGTTAGAQSTVTVRPVIGSFTAAPASVHLLGSSTLTPVFAGGTGVVTPGNVAVTSGVPISTGLLTATTTYTLTVTGSSGSPATAQATVAVTPDPDAITFTTEGASFAPVIVVDGTPTIAWTFGDGWTSSSATPSRAYGSAATRYATLKVTPWSAVRRINVGYDGGDGGAAGIEHVADQHVSAVQGLSLVAATLGQWCSSYNRLTQLDFSNFVNLDTIEAYLSTSLTTVTLRNTPKLARACFEQCSLTALDLSESPRLADLRGALNDFTDIQFGSGTFPDVWHVCTRDNAQLGNPALYGSLWQFPNIRDLWIWGDNQSGALALHSSSPAGRVDLRASLNHYSSLDLTGALQNPAAIGYVDVSGNQLTSVDLTGCTQLTELYLQNNRLPSAQVDAALGALNPLRRSQLAGVPLVVDLRGNAAPGSAGQAAAAALVAGGWTVYTD